MLAQVNFTTDSALKRAAAAKAKKQGVTLKVLFNFFLKSYTKGDIELGLNLAAKDNVLTKEEIADYKKAKKDLSLGRNIIEGKDAFAKLGV